MDNIPFGAIFCTIMGCPKIEAAHSLLYMRSEVYHVVYRSYFSA